MQQREMERAALARLALRPNLPAVRLDDAPRDIEAEPEAAAVGLGRLRKALENGVQVVGGDPAPAVADRKPNPALHRRKAERDFSACLRELHRVADQVREHLEDSIVVEAREE